MRGRRATAGSVTAAARSRRTIGLALGIAASIATLAVHRKSAHGLPEAALAMLNDPETLANVQEASGLKFLRMSKYEVLRREVDRAPELIGYAKEALQKKLAETDEKMMDSRRAELESLLKHPLLALEKYCGDCLWNNTAITCDTRVAYVQEKYELKLITAKVVAMDHPSCIKN